MTAATEEGGEKVAVEGAVITVVDLDGNEAGAATSAADGTWAVEGLAAGTYVVSIDPDSLPDGTTLNNPGPGQPRARPGRHPESNRAVRRRAG